MASLQSELRFTELGSRHRIALPWRGAAVQAPRRNLRSHSGIMRKPSPHIEIDAHKLSLDFAFFTPQIHLYCSHHVKPWKNPEGQLVETCSIITTTPNALLADIHDRIARHSA